MAGVPNIEIEVYRIRSIPIGAGVVTLPKFLRNSPSIIPLIHRQGKKQFPCIDNLCLFRCLGLQFGADVEAVEHVSQE